MQQTNENIYTNSVPCSVLLMLSFIKYKEDNNWAWMGFLLDGMEQSDGSIHIIKCNWQLYYPFKMFYESVLLNL